MTARTQPRTRRELVRALLSAPDRENARKLARSAAALADETTSWMIFRRFNRFVRGRRSDAEAAAQAGAAIASVETGRVCRAVSHWMTGVLDHVSGHPGASSRRLSGAAELFEKEGRWIEAGDVHRALVHVLMFAGHDKEARLAARKAARCYARGGGADSRRLGSLAMNVGNIHHRRDRLQEALDAYAEARRHFVRTGEAFRPARADYNRANVLSSMDRTREARRLYERARAVFIKEKLKRLVAQADYALAVLDLLEGSLDPCLHRLERVRRRQEDLGDRLGVAHTDLESAEAYLRLNRPADAERVARRAERFFRRAGHDAESAICAGLIGGAALQQGRPSVASRLFRQGREIQRSRGNAVGAALLGIGLAQAESRIGRPDRATKVATHAATVLRRAGLDSREARALAVGAEAALSAGRHRSAQTWAQRALSLARRRRDLRTELAALIVLSRIEQQAGRSGSAYRRLKAAERRVEQLRRGITAEESRLAFALDKSEVYEALITNRLERGDARSIRQALVFAERGKARALAERLADGRLETLGKASPKARELLVRLSDVERKLALAESRLEDPAATPGLRSARTSRLQSLTRSRIKTLETLSRKDPECAVLVGAPPPDPWEGVETLGPREMVLEYAQSDGYFHLFLIQRGSVEAFPKLARLEQVRDLVDLLRFQLGKGVLGEAHAQRYSPFIAATFRSYLERLHDLLLGPVAHRIEGRPLRIVPHGLLHGLPFQALESGGSALVDRCLISYAPSLAVIGLLARRRPAPLSPPLVLGVPDQSAPLIEAEVDTIRRHVHEALVFRGRDATTEALRLSEGRPPLLHVACHGFYSEGGSGGLRLGDNWLSLPDIYAMRRTADLVVLSGCETGRGTVYSGDEWIGLVRGFLQAGARSVVASLWEVQDRGTVSLMRDFYEGLSHGRSVAEALAVAQRKARAEDPLPLRWAPFMLIGDPRLKIRIQRVA